MADKEQIREKLWDLHSDLTEFFRDLLKNNQESIKGSTLDAIRAFLKDNSITRDELSRTKGFDLEGLGDLMEDWGTEVDPDDEDNQEQESEEQYNGKQKMDFKFKK